MKKESINYHFMIDEKFIDDFSKDALSISENNRFIFTFSPPSNFVKTTTGSHAPYGSQELDELLQQVTSNDRIFIHWYSPNVNTILNRIPKETKIFLCFWGADFLEAPFFANPNNRINQFLYDPLTFSTVRKSILTFQNEALRAKMSNAKEGGNRKNIIATYWQNKKQQYKTKSNRAYQEGMEVRKAFLERLEAICHWNIFDVEILNDLYNVQLKHRYFVYGVGTDNIKTSAPNQSETSKTITIWLGNSDTETNNHMDAMEMLKKYNDKQFKIICPLNYGNKAYAKIVCDYGTKYFGDRFVPLLDFIPRDKYYALMDEVDVVYMNHNRGQAGGNLFAFINKGKKIFMKEQSSIYKLFVSLGMHIHSTAEIKNTSFEDFSSPLSADQIGKNIKILKDSVSNETKRIDALKSLLIDE